jgi:hypothetical protein
LTDTDDAPFSENVQLFTFPLVAHAPEKIASRPLPMLRVIDVPTVNDADPLLPLTTSRPAGVVVTWTPLRPLTESVNAAVCGGGAGGVTVSVALREAPAYVAEMVTGVDEVTADVGTLKTALVAPAATVTLAGTPAIPGLLLASDTAAPPAGAASVRNTTP